MAGHGSAEEQELVGRLEATLDLDRSPVEDLIELGQLYIEPCHREADAISLFEAVLTRAPENGPAQFWLAHCHLHYLMDPEALQRAAQLLESVIATDSRLAGAAYLLLAEVLEAQGSLTLDRKIHFLEASLRCEPDWVYNRQSLAWAYEEAGRFYDALGQLRQAAVNVKVAHPNWSVTTRNFEESVTGRIGHRVAERLASDVEKVTLAMKGASAK